MFRASIREMKGGFRASVTTDTGRLPLGTFDNPVLASLRILRASAENMELQAMMAGIPQHSGEDTSLAAFIRDNCHCSPGERIRFSEFYPKFIEHLPQDLRARWPKSKVIESLPSQYPFGRSTHNRRYIGNLSWTAPASPAEHVYVAFNGRLQLQ